MISLLIFLLAVGITTTVGFYHNSLSGVESVGVCWLLFCLGIGFVVEGNKKH